MTHSHRFLAALITVASVASASAQGFVQSNDDVIASAAHAAAVIGIEWLGPHPPAEANLAVRKPLWQGPGAMFIEQQVAQRAIRSWWPEELPDANADAMLDGFAFYLQTRAIEREFDRRYLKPGHSVEARRYFGGQVIWSFRPLRITRQAVVSRNRYGALFEALDRWIGVSTLQGAMFQVARLPPDQLTAGTIVTTISAAAGQDLSWAFDAAEGEVDYAVAGLSSANGSDCAAPCVDTTVAVVRNGDRMFAGRSAGRSGDFESGDALLLSVTFADGTAASTHWDGRDAAHSFVFRGPSRATAAHLDPDRIVMLDRHRFNNAIVAPETTNVPVRKWVARWIVWLQHTMLSYGSLA